MQEVCRIDDCVNHMSHQVQQQLGGRSETTFTRFGFFDHLPPCVYIFYGMNAYKKTIFLTTYPILL